MTTRAELDRDVTQEHVRRILTDTGYCCRNLLGWNYDEYGGVRTNDGHGGVRNSGTHQRMVEVVDRAETRFKLIEAPRGSYKSTILQGYVIRRILGEPNIRILYVSATDDLALEKSRAIRAALKSDAVRSLFGEQEGEPWEEDRFTVCKRTQHTLTMPTFSTFGMESMSTGGRADLIILDDPIDQENCTTEQQVEKSKSQWAMIHPFIALGGTLIVVGTRYSADDLFSDLEQNPLFAAPFGESFVIGAGVHVVKNEQTGSLDIEEDETGLTFPHMTMDFLREKFMGMTRSGKYVQFSCQYLNVVPSSTGSMFHRWMFQPIPWGYDMHALSGYLLTDTAMSLRDEGCYSVVAYVALDALDNIYVLDLRVGHWEQKQFIDTFFDVLEEWSQKVNHCGEVWEEVALANAYEYSVREGSRQKKIRLNTLKVKRLAKDNKHMRIQRLHAPMHDRKLHIVSTVPRFFDDLDGRRLLWDPEGHVDPRTKIKEPGGELVHEFVRFKAPGVKNDVADTLAMILEFEKHGPRLRRLCAFKPNRRPPPVALTEQRTLDYRAEHYPQAGQRGDWWERTATNLHGRI